MAALPSIDDLDLEDLGVGPALDALKSTGQAVASAAAHAARDGAYTAVGLGLLAYQRAQVRRREIERNMRDDAS